MSEELVKAIEIFCVALPENKIGTYSPQANDDARLKEILETALKNNEEVRIQNLIEGLKKWQVYYLGRLQQKWEPKYVW